MTVRIIVTKKITLEDHISPGFNGRHAIHTYNTKDHPGARLSDDCLRSAQKVHTRNMVRIISPASLCRIAGIVRCSVNTRIKVSYSKGIHADAEVPPPFRLGLNIIVHANRPNVSMQRACVHG